MQISTKQLVDTTRNTILESVTNDTQAVISLLRKNGIQVPEDAQPTQVFIILIKAIKDSATVRKDYTNYLKTYVDSFKNYVDNLNADAEGTGTTTKKSYQDTFFGGIFPPEKLGQYLDTGINLYTTNLANQSQRQSEENALKLEQAKANTYYAQGMANIGTGGGTGAGAGAGAGGGKGKTLTYVLVGLLVVGAGVGAYFYFRKK
jgi:hypothetical protein